MAIRKYGAEFFGAFIFVLCACCTAILADTIGALAVALASGLALVLLRYVLRDFPCCYYNPAVTLGLLLAGRLKVKAFFGYLAAQFSGAIAGAGLVYYLCDGAISGGYTGLGAGYIPPHVYIPQALLLEFLLAFLFVLSVLVITANPDLTRLDGLLIGLCLTLMLLLGQPFTGGILNPARALAPTLLVRGEWLAQVWVFCVAPLAGGALAPWAARLLGLRVTPPDIS